MDDGAIGRRVRAARGNMSQAQLAATMSAQDVPWVQNTVTATETGKRPLRFAEAVVLANELGISLDSLAGRPSVTEAEEKTDQAIGQRVRELRELRGMPQQHVAMVMTLTKGYRWHQTVVAKVERGERSLKLAEAVALADILGVPVGELVEQRGTHVERGLAIAELRALIQHIEARAAELEG